MPPAALLRRRCAPKRCHSCRSRRSPPSCPLSTPLMKRAPSQPATPRGPLRPCRHRAAHRRAARGRRARRDRHAHHQAEARARRKAAHGAPRARPAPAGGRHDDPENGSPRRRPLRCAIVEGGVNYNGTTYTSLSGAALAASRDLGLQTKTVDGWSWWGLKDRAASPSKKNVIESLERAFDKYRERADAAVKTASAEDAAKLRDAFRSQSEALSQIATLVAE